MRWTKTTAALPLVLIFAGCTPDATPTDPGVPAPLAERGGLAHFDATAALHAVNAGNQHAYDVSPSLVPPGAPLAPFVEARLYAIAYIAMHDALNAINPRFERYADNGPIDRSANPAVAVLTAAHDAIVGADPGAQSATDAWYAEQMSALDAGEGVDEGIAVGQRVASAILSRRANDGTAGGGVAPYTPGSLPGDYQFTFPFNTPDFNFFGTGGFADASIWGTTVTPFVLTSGAQFRAPRPYGASSNAEAVLTDQYTRDYNEIKSLGCLNCADRTPEQTEIALFWAESSASGWNRIARSFAAARNMDAWQAARLYALVEIGVFDSYTTAGESKYFYNFWRPETAVALADNDGNPGTSSAAGWAVLFFPTPPVPDYPSAHAEVGATAGTVIDAIVPGTGRPFSQSSMTLPGVTRTFTTIDSAIRENGVSRIYIGYHFRTAVDAGIAQGRLMGDYIASNALKPIRP
jgi:hypothetical protein